MSINETGTTIKIMDDTVDIINSHLSKCVEQIETECKANLKTYIQDKMTMYYGKRLNQTFETFKCDDVDCICILYGIKPNQSGFHQLVITTTNIYNYCCNHEIHPNFRHDCVPNKFGQSASKSSQISDPFDINNPCIQILIDITMMMFPHMRRLDTSEYGNQICRIRIEDSIIPGIYGAFVHMLKEFETDPLKYIQTDSKLIEDLRIQLESIKNKKEQMITDSDQNKKNSKYLDDMRIQLEIEKKELQDYRNIKQEIEKCNKLKKQLVMFKLELQKEQQQLESDKKQLEKEQSDSLNINLDDELLNFTKTF